MPGRPEIRNGSYGADDGNKSGTAGNGAGTDGAGTKSGADGGVKKSAEDAKKATQLNPQPEPPAPQKGIFEAIAEFFARLFGMK